MAKKADRAATVGTWLASLHSRLDTASDTPGLDSQLLLARVLGQPRSLVLAHPEAVLASDQAAELEALAARLQAGEPLPYVLGHWEFFGLDFEVTKDVLIPRPETELLVEKALGWLHGHPAGRRLADVGTGSGCIGISLAVNVPDLQVTATDVSCPAVDLACANARRLGVDGRVKCFCSDLLPADRGAFDLIVANLPYIPTGTLRGLRVFGREPTLALDGGMDGLELIRRLLTEVPGRLQSPGLLLMEIEASQGDRVLSLAYDTFSEAEIHLHQDIAGRDRLLEVLV